MKLTLKIKATIIIVASLIAMPPLVQANGAASAAGRAAGKYLGNVAKKGVRKFATDYAPSSVSRSCMTPSMWCQTSYPLIVGSSCGCVDASGYVSYGSIR